MRRKLLVMLSSSFQFQAYGFQSSFSRNKDRVALQSWVARAIESTFLQQRRYVPNLRYQLPRHQRPRSGKGSDLQR
ncbi:hypothetical protein F5B17DRAFT_411713 [Nemania serpens]|nr:hypothetical protein F5B17DRAFT_411713 [Nemania serpens]